MLLAPIKIMKETLEKTVKDVEWKACSQTERDT